MTKKITAVEWQQIRLRYEAGETPQQIADTMDDRISVKSIRNRRALENWQNKVQTIYYSNPVILQDKIIAEYQKIAFANIKQFGVFNHGELLIENLNDINHEDACAIAEVVKTPQGYKVKLYDKLEALSVLAKYLGLLDGKITKTDLLQKPIEVVLKELL